MVHVCRCKTCDRVVDGALDAHISLIWKYAELAKIVERIIHDHKANWSDSLNHAIADAEDFLTPVERKPLMTEAEETEALSYMDKQ